VEFAGKILSSIIKPLWDRFASQMSGYNAFISTNIDLFADTMPAPDGSLIISKGKMAATTVETATKDFGGGGLSVTWVDDSGEGSKLATDEAYGVACNNTKEEVAYSSAEVVRSGLGIADTEWTGVDGWENTDVIYIYLAFRRADGTIVSDTSYSVTTAV
jgi:hypothetical protein